MEFVLDNVVGTCNILNFARTVDNLELFMYFSTDEIFGLLRMESNIKKMIDIIQQIHTVQQRQVEKN